jgi:hypothetical protein
MQERFQDKIQSLVEKRVIEATKKQLTQKLVCISKYLGRSIIAQTLFNKDFDDREEDFIYDREIPMMRFSEDRTYAVSEWEDKETGFHFDGLRCGINLCVTALIYDNKLEELKATYNGYLVFAEVEGELKAYAPFPAWEDAVEMFYEAAIQKERKTLLEENAKKKQQNQEKMKGFWQKFRMLWGY